MKTKTKKESDQEKKMVKETKEDKTEAAKKESPLKKGKIPVEKQETKKEPKKKYYYAVGRRKEAVAKAKLWVERGEIQINGKPISQYFPGEYYKTLYNEPFRTTNMLGRWSGQIKVEGGGYKSHLGAVILAVSRCLLQYDPEKFRPILRKRGFLTRDPRVKERKKPGLMGARKEKQSPKR